MSRLIIFPILAIVLAVIIRILSGSPHMFYACNCSRGVFPPAFFYGLIYTVRLILSSLILGSVVLSKRYLPNKAYCIISALFSFATILLEYKILMVNENFLITLTLIFASIFMVIKALKKCLLKKYVNILIVVLTVMQALMAYFIISLII